MKSKLIIYVLDRMREEPISRRLELLKEMHDLVPSRADRDELDRLIIAYQQAEHIHDQLLLKL